MKMLTEDSKMIFVTLGSQKFQFNRLLKAVDQLVGDGLIDEKIFAQIGHSDYKPIHYAYKDFLDRDEFSRQMSMADIVITHGGTGVIIGAIKKGKKVIAVPRLAKHGEHIDDHQLQLVNQFDELGLICQCQDADKIGDALETVKRTEYKAYKSNTQTIVESIMQFIEQ